MSELVEPFVEVIRVERFPAVVTMDSHGRSIHDEVEKAQKQR